MATSFHPKHFFEWDGHILYYSGEIKITHIGAERMCSEIGGEILLLQDEHHFIKLTNISHILNNSFIRLPSFNPKDIDPTSWIYRKFLIYPLKCENDTRCCFYYNPENQKINSLKCDHSDQSVLCLITQENVCQSCPYKHLSIILFSVNIAFFIIIIACVIILLVMYKLKFCGSFRLPRPNADSPVRTAAGSGI